MDQYSCRLCTARDRCIDQSENADRDKTMIRTAFDSQSDTLATWALLQENCLLVKEEQPHPDPATPDSVPRPGPTPAGSAESPPPQPPHPNNKIIRRLTPRHEYANLRRRIQAKLWGRKLENGNGSPSTGQQPARPLKPLFPTLPSSQNGSGEYWLTIESSGRHIALPKSGRLVLGRFDPHGGIPPDIDLTYEDNAAQLISRRHALIFGQDGRHIIEDLGSSAGVFLNGDKVDFGPTRPLSPGDHIRLGNVGLRYEAVPSGRFESVREEALRHRLLVTPTNRKLTISPYRKTIIGRVDPNIDFRPDIDLSSDGDAAQLVSRRHALIQWQQGQAYLEDLGSRFGTRLGGELVRPGQPVPLKAGDHIWLGGCVLAYDILVVG